MTLVRPELVTEYRPDHEKVCPICGEPYMVIQRVHCVNEDGTREVDPATGLIEERDYIRVGCWNHFYFPEKIVRMEQLQTINGREMKTFAESYISAPDERNCNGYGMEPSLPLEHEVERSILWYKLRKRHIWLRYHLYRLKCRVRFR